MPEGASALRTRLSNRLGASLAAVLLLLGCSARGPAPPPTAGGSYMPLRAGNTWTYTSRRGELVIRVADVRPVNGALEITVEEADRQRKTVRTYRQDEMGLFLLRSVAGGEVQDYSQEPQPVLLLPPKPGQRWVWRGQMGQRQNHYTAEVEQPESVTTPAGTFADTLPVHVGVMDKVMRNKSLQHRQWLAPGVGPVRMDFQVEDGEVIRYDLTAYHLQ